jgi:hypothetical protein
VWTALSAYQDADDRQWILDGTDKTIAEAEIACITAIYEARDE